MALTVEFIEDGREIWQVDWALVQMLVRSHAHYESILIHSKIESLSQTDWYNPLSWPMPDLVQYEVDWDAATNAKKEATRARMMEFQNNIYDSVESVKRHLKYLIEETHHNKEKFRNNLRTASQETSANIDQAVNTYETATTVARVTRDISADTILIGATFLSGGAALGVAGAGSMMKGAGTFQDTGNVGAAIMETTGSFIFTAIPIGRAASGAATASLTEKGTLVLFESQFEVAKGLAAGDNIEKAMANRALKIATSATGDIIGDKVRVLVSKTGLPATIRISPWSNATADLEELVTKQANGHINTQLIGGIGKSAVNYLTDRRSNRPSTRRAMQVEPATCIGADEFCADMNVLDRAVQRIGSVQMERISRLEQY